MAKQRKIFRIEEASLGAIDVVDGADDAARPHADLLAELATLRALVKAPPQQDVDDETRQLREAAERTAHEIAALRLEGHAALLRAARELDAIARGTENATQRILQAAEDIEQTANTLGATLKSDHEREMAEDIQDRTTQLFEACNFQDLAGQQIASVAATLHSVQQRISTLLEIWSAGVAGVSAPHLPAKDNFLHGPRLDGEAGHYSQNDVDELFADKPRVMSSAA